MANINKIRLSGQTYNIEDSNAPKTVELTQAQYDALAVKDPNTFYIITDAQGADLSQYYTSAQTESAITQAVSGKQDTLVSGTNIKTINNESLLGSGNIDIQGGGGASYSAGDGIDITNDVISVTGKVDTTTYETYTAATATAIGDKLAVSDFNTYSGTVDTAINSKASQSDLSTLSGTVTAHTANTDIHVTTAQTAAWDAKSDFSGSYNDLTDKPTIPTSASQLTNDVGYLVANDITGKTDTSAFTAHTSDSDIHVTSSEKSTWNAKSDFSGSYNDLTDKPTLFSGDYNDLTNKPTIPTVPTSNTAFTNDAGYITSSALDGYATEQWVGQQGYLTQHQDISGKQDVSGMTAYTEVSAFTAHTANTDIHVTTAQTAAWNAKSDFSGSYNDLTDKPTIPTVPTSNTAFTNDAGYITSDAISGKADTSAVTESINAAVSGKVDTSTFNTYSGSVETALSGKQDTLVSRTNIKTINNESILGSGNIEIQGGGKAIVGGRGITVTSGETADTINCTLPISAGTGAYSAMLGQPVSTSDGSANKTITGGQWSKAFSEGGVSIGQMNESRGQWAWAIGNNTRTNGKAAFACGDCTSSNNKYAFSEGTNTTANTQASHAAGSYTSTKNRSEFSIGEYNNSVSASTTFGNSGNTLFSVGNGTSNSARHNAFEIRQNGDIYLNDGSKLQDTVSATTANTTALGGLKLVKLSQSEYDSLSTKDNSTLYVIVN